LSGKFIVTVGNDKLVYDASPDAGNIARPVATPADFNWKSLQGVHLQGKEFIRHRMYPAAEEKIREALKIDANYLPALTDLSMLLYRSMKYEEALQYAKKALSVDTYDPAANYYYGLINVKLGSTTDAKDGFDIASQAVEYRSASYTQLAQLYLREKDPGRCAYYANQAIDFNKYAIDAYELLAVIYRLQNKRDLATKMIDSISKIDPLNHFANFERYVWDASDKSKNAFTANIRNEMPNQTYLELASWYYNAGQNADALKVLEIAPADAEIMYWRSFLANKPFNADDIKPGMVFPFRPETAEILQHLMKSNDSWLPKYHLALIQWSSNNIPAAKQLFEQCGNTPSYAPFYAARAKLFKDDNNRSLADLQKAHQLDGKEWRYGRALINHYIENKQYDKALSTADTEYKKFPANYVLGMLYARSLMLNREYAKADQLLSKIQMLPNEGATLGRQLYREAKLMLAMQNIKAGNCKKALQYLADSRLWPERLGSGKPYEADIDLRLEDWLSYECLVKTKNEASAAKMLDNIVSYTSKIQPQSLPNVNNLISAWALKKTGKAAEAEKFLKDIAAKHPSDPIAQWTLDAYRGNATKIDLKSNENYNILQQLMASSH
jgi:predicted Zn-dependent protease